MFKIMVLLFVISWIVAGFVAWGYDVAYDLHCNVNQTSPFKIKLIAMCIYVIFGYFSYYLIVKFQRNICGWKLW